MEEPLGVFEVVKMRREPEVPSMGGVDDGGVDLG